MPKKKQTLENRLLADCYKQLLKETGKAPSVEEVQQRYREKFGNTRQLKIN
jgi:hypothetical protein